MDINFEYYKTFYYVAKYRNITRAAAAMGSNQPNVTRVMKLLEAGLKCKLLVREARGITLTEEGERLYSHVEIAFHQLQKAQEEIGAQIPEGTGTVEIGATESALHLFLLNALRQFREICPKARIKIHNHSTPEILKNLAYGKLDFAVITTPFEISGQFVCRKLTGFREILVGGSQYRKLGLGKRKLEELKEYPWVGIGIGTSTAELYKEFFYRQNVNIEPDTEVATSDLLIPLIRANMGIGFVPEEMALPWLETQQLVRIYPECEPPEREIRLVYDSGRGRNAASESLQKYLGGLQATGPGSGTKIFRAT